MGLDQIVQSLPTGTTGYGFRTPFGVTLPPGSQVAAYVRSTGPQSNDDPAIACNLVSTLAAGLIRCRSGLGDTVFVLPGHSESVVDNTMLTNLVAATRIVGIGTGSSQPTFRWTAAAAQWLINKNDVYISGLKLRCEGFNGVTLAIDVTGSDVTINECDIETSSGAANLAAIVARVSAGANRCCICDNRIRGVAAGVSTDVILVNAAVDGLQVMRNTIDVGSTNGMLRTAAAATAIKIVGNSYYNLTAALAGVCGAQAADGYMRDNTFAVTGASTPATAWTQGGGTFRIFNSTFSDGTFLSGTVIGAGAAA